MTQFKPQNNNCFNCLHKTCQMSIEELLEKDFIEPKTKKHYIYKNIPDSFFLKAINLYRFLHGNEKVRYNRLSKNHWVIHYPDYDLHCPSSRWYQVTMDKFSQRFETFYPIEKNDVCVDIGSCIGDTTLPMVIKTGNGGKVFAVEPMPDNLHFLKLNVGQYPNVKIIPKAVSDKKGELTFYLHDTPTGHSLISLSERKFGEIKVNCDTLDNLLDDMMIDFCKIDIQGSEIDVLKAADKFFDNVNKLVVETHFRYDPVKNTYKDCLKILNKFDFDIRFCIYESAVIHAKKRSKK